MMNEELKKDAEGFYIIEKEYVLLSDNEALGTYVSRRRAESGFKNRVETAKTASWHDWTEVVQLVEVDLASGERTELMRTVVR